jgi:hypothetical protein
MSSRELELLWYWGEREGSAGDGYLRGTRLHSATTFARLEGRASGMRLAKRENWTLQSESNFCVRCFAGGTVGRWKYKYFSITFSRCWTSNDNTMMTSRRWGGDSVGIGSAVDEVFLQTLVANWAANGGGKCVVYLTSALPPIAASDCNFATSMWPMSEFAII